MKPQVTKSDYVRLSDEELTHRYVQRQDRAAISTLFERYGHLVYGVCLNYNKSAEAAKQATENIFMNLMEDLFKFKIEQFKPWLFLYVSNYCTSSGSSIQANKMGTANDFWAEDDREVSEKLEYNIRSIQVEPLLKQLTKEERICIELFYKQHLSYAEISDRTKYTIKDVRRFLQTGKKHLRDKLLTIAEVRK